MIRFTVLLLSSSALFFSSGCAAVLIGTGAAVVVDEANESRDCDDNFDPLEDFRGKEDGCN